MVGAWGCGELPSQGQDDARWNRYYYTHVWMPLNKALRALVLLRLYMGYITACSPLYSVCEERGIGLGWLAGWMAGGGRRAAPHVCSWQVRPEV